MQSGGSEPASADVYRRKVLCSIHLSRLRPEFVSSLKKRHNKSQEAYKPHEGVLHPPLRTRPRPIRTKAALKLFPEELMVLPEIMSQEVPPSDTEPVQYKVLPASEQGSIYSKPVVDDQQYGLDQNKLQSKPVQDNLDSGPGKIIIRLVKLVNGNGEDSNHRKGHKHKKGKYGLYTFN